MPIENAVYFAFILTFALALPRDVFAGGCSYRNGVDARSRAAGGAGAVWGRGALAGIAENPAALSAVRNPNLALNLSSASTVGQFANAASSSGLLAQGPFLVPEGAYAHPLGDSGWTIGGGVTPAMMLAGDWEYADPVGAGGASYGVHATTPNSSCCARLAAPPTASASASPSAATSGSSTTATASRCLTSFSRSRPSAD